MKNVKRNLSVYEKNQLLKYDKKESDFLSYGEMPVEYFTGRVEFKGLDLMINENVLIPRVETEELVDLLVSNLEEDQPLSYLEIGTGSGVISLAFLNILEKEGLFNKNNNFLLTDISKEALTVARKNLTDNLSQETLNQIAYLNTNLATAIENKKFNLIVANLPYIPSKDINELDQSVKDFEPILALDGGETGFELIAEFLFQVSDKKLLAMGGKIFLEVDQSHDQSFIKNNFPKIIDKYVISFIKDQFGRNRFLIIEELKS